MDKKTLPPASILRLKVAPPEGDLWHDKLGRYCRVGFYNQADGDEVVWLVNEDGEYCETTDLGDIEEYFEVVEISDVRDYYGDISTPLAAIAEPAMKWRWKKADKGSTPDS